MEVSSAASADNASARSSGIVPTPVLQDRPDYIAGVADAADVHVHRGRGLRCTKSTSSGAVDRDLYDATGSAPALTVAAS